MIITRMGDTMRLRRIATLLAAAGFLAVGATARLQAQAARPIQASAPADNRITADSAPYRIELNGSSGVFIRRAFAQEPETRESMTFLHTDAGPTGYAKHLAWFLA